mmetsp:Transcript_68789/g.114331  ORF Transcript_68789/g.114331 Transcript_68789/m.114331 type:complete len:306 (+) Transcript_68789:100-1017(+)
MAAAAPVEATRVPTTPAGVFRSLSVSINAKEPVRASPLSTQCITVTTVTTWCVNYTKSRSVIHSRCQVMCAGSSRSHCCLIISRAFCEWMASQTHQNRRHHHHFSRSRRKCRHPHRRHPHLHHHPCHQWHPHRHHRHLHRLHQLHPHHLHFRLRYRQQIRLHHRRHHLPRYHLSHRHHCHSHHYYHRLHLYCRQCPPHIQLNHLHHPHRHGRCLHSLHLQMLRHHRLLCHHRRYCRPRCSLPSLLHLRHHFPHHHCPHLRCPYLHHLCLRCHCPHLRRPYLHCIHLHLLSLHHHLRPHTRHCLCP